MDKTLLKKAAMQSVALMVAVVTLSYALQHYQAVTIAASNMVKEDAFGNSTALADTIEPTGKLLTSQQNSTSLTDAPIATLEELVNRVDEGIMSQLSDNYLVIQKPKEKDVTFQLEDLYINKSIRLTLTGITNNAITSSMITRVRDNEIFTGDPKYSEIVSQDINEENKASEEVITKDYGKDLSHGISITAGEDNITKLSTVQVLIELDSVYAYIIYEDANFYFIDLKKPAEVYDKILVIDAGHGGKDAGALSKGEKFYEKNINLDIVLQLKDLLDKENIKVYYTRTADDKVFLRPRVTLANAVDCDYFISIHCNANEVTSPNGTEVLYYDNEYKGVAAEELANLFSEELEKTVELERRGIVQKHLEDIFIMDKSDVPTVLIEVGYLTNNGDMDYLSSSVNRKAVAEGIYNGIMRAYKELPVTKEGQ